MGRGSREESRARERKGIEKDRNIGKRKMGRDQEGRSAVYENQININNIIHRKAQI